MGTDLQIRERPGDLHAGRSLWGLGGALAGIALRPLGAGVEYGLRAERELRGALGRRAEATALASLDALLASAFAREAIDRILASPLLKGPELERAVQSALDSPAMERLVVRAIESELMTEAVERLLQTDDLWLLVDEIARSPSVAAAVTQQSAGFVDEVAGSVRSRTRSADERLESRVRRIFGRAPRAEPPDEGTDVT